jgi:hypothetical protein
MAKYNGWTNYETWKANLELLDGQEPEGYDDEILECYDGKKWNKDELESVAENYAKYLESLCEEILDIESYDPFVESLINLFLGEVNFREIAENIIDDYKETLI